jgi:hypothetical protein
MFMVMVILWSLLIVSMHILDGQKHLCPTVLHHDLILCLSMMVQVVHSAPKVSALNCAIEWYSIANTIQDIKLCKSVLYFQSLPKPSQNFFHPHSSLQNISHMWNGSLPSTYLTEIMACTRSCTSSKMENKLPALYQSATFIVVPI